MKVKRLNLEKYKFVQRFIQAVNGFNQARQDDSLEGWVTLNHQHIHFNDEGIPDIGNPMVFGKKSFSEVDRSHVVPGQITKRPKPAAQNPGSSSSTAPAVSHETARKIVEGLPTSDQIQTGAQRKNFVKKIVENMGAKLSNVRFRVRALATGTHGQVGLTALSGTMSATELSLNSNDKRPMEYQLKTAFHEAFHLLANGRATDIESVQRRAWHNCEEVMTECAASYMFSQYSGENSKQIPSYAKEIVEYLPALKELDEFASCASIEDVGRVALEKRMNGEGTVWGGLISQIKPKSLTDKYYTRYVDYVNKNKNSFLNELYRAHPETKGFESYMEEELDLVLSGKEYNSLSGTQKNLYAEVLVYAMVQEGI